MKAQDEKLARLVADLQRAVIGAERDRRGLGPALARRPVTGRPGLSRG
jgi:hypothetical protein